MTSASIPQGRMIKFPVAKFSSVWQWNERNRFLIFSLNRLYYSKNFHSKGWRQAKSSAWSKPVEATVHGTGLADNL